MSFRHLHMYIHRIALSVILPPRPRPSDGKQPQSVNEGGTPLPKPSAEKRSPPLTDKDQGDVPAVTKTAVSGIRPGSRKLIKQATFALGFSSVSSSNVQEKVRPRSESLDSPVSSSNAAAEGKGVAQSGKSRRAPLSKQHSIHSDPGASVASEGSRASAGTLVGGVTVNPKNGERLWKGLKLDLLRSRIQRLIVVMNMSEPGSVPNAGMLASLIDLVSSWNLVLVCMCVCVCVCARA